MHLLIRFVKSLRRGDGCVAMGGGFLCCEWWRGRIGNMDTFPIVKRKDEAAHGEYCTKRVILEIYDAMQRAVETSQPYIPSQPDLYHRRSRVLASHRTQNQTLLDPVAGRSTYGP